MNKMYNELDDKIKKFSKLMANENVEKIVEKSQQIFEEFKVRFLLLNSLGI